MSSNLEGDHNNIRTISPIVKGWVGVDLDGTLAFYDYWRGIDHIGDPIPEMQSWIICLLFHGIDVRIFTARANTPEAIPYIEAWCKKHLYQVLPITATKDYDMAFYYDDRAVSVLMNEGKILDWNHQKNVLSGGFK